MNDDESLATRRTVILLVVTALLIGATAVGMLRVHEERLTITEPAPGTTAAAEEATGAQADDRGVRRAAPDDLALREPQDPGGEGGGPRIEGPQVRGLPHVAPERVAIPSLEVDSFLIDLGLNGDGSLEVPADFDVAGWYAEGPYPGDTNSPPALIVGHVDSKRGPAIFFRLKQIEIGATIEVTREDGSVAVFEVVDAKQHPKNSLPTDELYARRMPSELVLVTCTGEFNREAGSYLDNFVVTARLDREASLERS